MYVITFMYVIIQKIYKQQKLGKLPMEGGHFLGIYP